MNRVEFLEQLRTALYKLPGYIVKRSLAQYDATIDKRMDAGVSEEEAVASLGKVDTLAAQIIKETPLVPKVIGRLKTKSHELNIVLLILLSPIWISIACACALAFLIAYLAIWVVIVSLWGAALVTLVSGVAAFVSSYYLIVAGFTLPALLRIGIGFILIGLGVFCFFGVRIASKGLVGLTKTYVRKVRRLFAKEGSAQ